MFDVTLLDPKATPAMFDAVANKVIQYHEQVSAVCVYASALKYFVNTLSGFPSIGLGTVLNFPRGNMDLTCLKAQTRMTVSEGATEFDLVIPYMGFTPSNYDLERKIQEYIWEVRDIIGWDCILKTILESGSQEGKLYLPYLADICLNTEAIDYLKTSTGKIETGATIQAVKIIIHAIKAYAIQWNRLVGIKVSGGIRTYEQVNEYLKVIREEMRLCRTSVFEQETKPFIRFGIGQTSKALEECKK